MKCKSCVIVPGFESNYDKHPFIAVPRGEGECVEGWSEIVGRLCDAVGKDDRVVVVVDCYVGVHVDRIRAELGRCLKPMLLIDSQEAFRDPNEIDRLVMPFLGDDDPIFGFLCGLTMEQFLDARKQKSLRDRVEQADGLVLIVGVAASAIHDGDILVYADMPAGKANSDNGVMRQAILVWETHS